MVFKREAFHFVYFNEESLNQRLTRKLIHISQTDNFDITIKKRNGEEIILKSDDDLDQFIKKNKLKPDIV